MSVVDFTSQGTIGTSLKPKRYDIEIYQGDTFSFNLTLKDAGGLPIDVTGWTVLAQIKKLEDSTPGEAPVFASEVVGVDGVIALSLTDTATAALNGETTYKYDVQLTDTAGNKRTYIGGKITVTEDISE